MEYRGPDRGANAPHPSGAYPDPVSASDGRCGRPSVRRPRHAPRKTERAFGVRREHFEPGELIFREGDQGDRLYILVNGEVEVLREAPGRGEATLRRLGPGECFGEIALVQDSPRTATVRAATAVNLLAVDREAFQALFAHLPPLRGFFEQLIARRLGPPA